MLWHCVKVSHKLSVRIFAGLEKCWETLPLLYQPSLEINDNKSSDERVVVATSLPMKDIVRRSASQWLPIRVNCANSSYALMFMIWVHDILHALSIASGTTVNPEGSADSLVTLLGLKQLEASFSSDIHSLHSCDSHYIVSHDTVSDATLLICWRSYAMRIIRCQPGP